jgi:hypothetical protein
MSDTSLEILSVTHATGSKLSLAQDVKLKSTSLITSDLHVLIEGDPNSATNGPAFACDLKNLGQWNLFAVMVVYVAEQFDNTIPRMCMPSDFVTPCTPLCSNFRRVFSCAIPPTPIQGPH